MVEYIYIFYILYIYVWIGLKGFFKSEKPTAAM